MVTAVIVLQAAMPASTILVILGMEYDGDVLYCAEGVFITHLLGLFDIAVCVLPYERDLK